MNGGVNKVLLIRTAMLFQAPKDGLLPPGRCAEPQLGGKRLAGLEKQ
jgi:hypothetical protein